MYDVGYLQLDERWDHHSGVDMVQKFGVLTHTALPGMTPNGIAAWAFHISDPLTKWVRESGRGSGIGQIAVSGIPSTASKLGYAARNCLKNQASANLRDSFRGQDATRPSDNVLAGHSYNISPTDFFDDCGLFASLSMEVPTRQPRETARLLLGLNNQIFVLHFNMWSNLVASSIGVFATYVLCRVIKMAYMRLTSPLRNLPGPKSAHWVSGSLTEIMNNLDLGLEETWLKRYGPTMRVNGFFGESNLYTIDTKAIQHILTNSNYQKPEIGRYDLARIVGPGILVAEGDVHKQQNPAFGAPQIRQLTGIFVDKSVQLRDLWASEAAQNGGVAHVEAVSWLNKATLDIIGLAGFNHDVNALGAKSGQKADELAAAFDTLTGNDRFTLLRVLRFFFPPLRHISTKDDKLSAEAQVTMMRIGRKLLADSKRAIAESGTFETGRTRDLLNLLVRANTSKEIPVDQRLSDADVLARASFAGFSRALLTQQDRGAYVLGSWPRDYEVMTRAIVTATAWALFALTQNTAAQTRLRTELLSLDKDYPTMDDLNNLPYLDCVVREVLRLHAPVPIIPRTALSDDVLPFGVPFVDGNGIVHDALRIPAGTTILIPIGEVNRDLRVWGPDAKEFIPERWESPITNTIPGVWGHMLTFLGGPRSCIGYRFSLVEMKALLFALVRDLEFELAVPGADVGRKSGNVTQLPMLRTWPLLVLIQLSADCLIDYEPRPITFYAFRVGSPIVLLHLSPSKRIIRVKLRISQSGWYRWWEWKARATRLAWLRKSHSMANGFQKWQFPSNPPSISSTFSTPS
ncbi:cytochrome P450 [Mycena vulgaris]|nr:cytochrome P450 [Mycena vulgaris]